MRLVCLELGIFVFLLKLQVIVFQLVNYLAPFLEIKLCNF